MVASRNSGITNKLVGHIASYLGFVGSMVTNTHLGHINEIEGGGTKWKPKNDFLVNFRNHPISR